MQAGTEYTASTTASGIRDIGNVNSQQYADSAGNWHFITGFDHSSPNNWITEHFNSPEMTWSGPC
jgi:hypothetical protein